MEIEYEQKIKGNLYTAMYNIPSRGVYILDSQPEACSKLAYSITIRFLWLKSYLEMYTNPGPKPFLISSVDYQHVHVTDINLQQHCPCVILFSDSSNYNGGPHFQPRLHATVPLSLLSSLVDYLTSFDSLQEEKTFSLYSPRCYD